MSRVNFDTLLEAGCHFGHLKRKWNPAMAPYIFMERNGIHIIDLNKTVAKVDEAAEALKQIAKSGKKVLFVATKKQAKQVVAEKAASVNMPYVIERWNTEVTSKVIVPQGIHIIEKAQITNDHKVQLLRSGSITDRCGKGTFNAARTPVATNLYRIGKRIKLGITHGGTIGQMQSTRSRQRLNE